MVVIPCSMGTLGAIAQGAGRHLVHRAGEVFLKERRPLILVVRETPLSLIHLQNLVRAARRGSHHLPGLPRDFTTGPGPLTNWPASSPAASWTTWAWNTNWGRGGGGK